MIIPVMRDRPRLTWCGDPAGGWFSACAEQLLWGCVEQRVFGVDLCVRGATRSGSRRGSTRRGGSLRVGSDQGETGQHQHHERWISACAERPGPQNGSFPRGSVDLCVCGATATPLSQRLTVSGGSLRVRSDLSGRDARYSHGCYGGDGLTDWDNVGGSFILSLLIHLTVMGLVMLAWAWFRSRLAVAASDRRDSWHWSRRGLDCV